MAGKKGGIRRLWIILGAVAVIGLVLLSSKPDGPESGAGGRCLVRITADNAPVRSGPDANDPPAHTLPSGLVIQANRTVRNGFREILPNRWVAERQLDQLSGSNCG